MGSWPSWAPVVADALGPPGDLRSLGGSVWRVTIDGRPLVVKQGDGAPFEADGLGALAAVPGGPPVPEVVYVIDDLLVTSWVPTGRRTTGAEERLGRTLATLHAAPWPVWGGGAPTIGPCRIDPAEHPDGASFYGARLTELAARCGLGAPVGRVVDRLGDLLPTGPPALLHGDLWWGNVCWALEDTAWVIDPSVHGGHPEEDLAMLGLFGTVPDRLVGAYREVHPLAPGWEERVELFQLYPLLVHAVAFGGGYGPGPRPWPAATPEPVGRGVPPPGRPGRNDDGRARPG